MLVPPSKSPTPPVKSPTPVVVPPPTVVAEPVPGVAAPLPPALLRTGPAAVPPPVLRPGVQGIAPPPFMQQPQKEEVKVDPEEVRRKLWESVPEIRDDAAAEHPRGSKAFLGTFLALLGTVAISIAVGWLSGGQIYRTVRGTRAIDSALALYTKVDAERELMRGIKSRVSGAARKALSPTDPAADFELLDYLAKVRDQQPFTAQVWVTEHYQYFKAAPLVFQYHSSSQALWRLIQVMDNRYKEASTRAALEAWPQRRGEVLALIATDEVSGYAVMFRSEGGKILGSLATFHGAKRITEAGKSVMKAEVRPLGGGEARTLSEFPPDSAAPLSDAPDQWFIRLNPETIVGPQRLIVNDPGPLLAKEQDAYRQYLTDLNQLSLGLQSVQSDQDRLMQALAEIKQAPRPFTFGF